MTRTLDVLKTIRASPLFNLPATATLRAMLRVLGRESELAIRHLPRSGFVVVPLPNGRRLRLWSRGDDWIANQVYWRGWNGYEPETSSLFFRLASSARTVLDIGAHVGYYTLLAALANAAVRAYAFEPMPSAFARLERNVALNGVGPQVTCVASAVGAADGAAEFFCPVSTGIPSSASLSREFVHARADAVSIRVPVVTVDRFVHDRGVTDVDLVKLDTESTEVDVLHGMTTVLRRDRPVIFTEVLTTATTAPLIEEILRPFDYRYYALRPDGPAEIAHITPDPESRNQMFAPAEKAVVRPAATSRR